VTPSLFLSFRHAQLGTPFHRISALMCFKSSKRIQYDAAYTALAGEALSVNGKIGSAIPRFEALEEVKSSFL